MIAAVEMALLCACAEAMYDGKNLAPPLDARVGDEWEIIAHLTGADALFSLQRLGLGERVYYGFVAVSKQYPKQFVAIVRGTENALEWMIDFQGLPVPGVTVHDGMVEQGFFSIALSMLLRDLRIIQSSVADSGIDKLMPDGATLTFGGHSLGAPISAYLAKSVKEKALNRYAVSAALFACPKPGDATFARAFDTALVADYGVYNYVRDIVPHAPPSLFGFRDLPRRSLITPQNAIWVPSNPFDLKANHQAINYARMLGYTGE